MDKFSYTYSNGAFLFTKKFSRGTVRCNIDKAFILEYKIY